MWAEDDDSRFGRSRPPVSNVPDIPTPSDATSICDAIQQMFVYIREQGWMPQARPLYDPLQECVQMLYVDQHEWTLREQSDNYAEVMTRVNACLKQAYAACQTQKRVHAYVPYDTYATFVDICRMCGRYLHDSVMSQSAKMTRELYTDRQIKVLAIVQLESQLEEAEIWKAAYKHQYEQERDQNMKLQEQIGGQKREWRDGRNDDVEAEKKHSEEVASLKTEIQVLQRQHSEEVARLKTEIQVLQRKRPEEVASHTPQQNTDPKHPQKDSAVKPRSRWFPFMGQPQYSPVTILLADLSHLSDREHFEGPFNY